MGSTRYIMSMGELTRKDNSLCFRKNGKNVYIPVENTKEIFCFNEVSINTKLLDFLSQNNIIVHFFNYYGGYSGTYYPRDHYLSGKLLVKKFINIKSNTPYYWSGNTHSVIVIFTYLLYQKLSTKIMVSQPL